jgi:hypothetical protein
VHPLSVDLPGLLQWQNGYVSRQPSLFRQTRGVRQFTIIRWYETHDDHATDWESPDSECQAKSHRIVHRPSFETSKRRHIGGGWSENSVRIPSGLCIARWDKMTALWNTHVAIGMCALCISFDSVDVNERPSHRSFTQTWRNLHSERPPASVTCVYGLR